MEQKTPPETDRTTISAAISLARSMENVARTAIDAERAKQLADDKARHDELTGLLNRWGLEEEYGKVAENSPGDFSIVVVDLDDLREINNSRGHLAGDDLLKDAAEAMTDSLRTHQKPEFPDRELDTVAVARVGGDEFTLLLKHVNDPDTLSQVIERIRDKLDEKRIRASIGGSIHRVGIDFVQLVKEADEALYRDKGRKKLRLIGDNHS